jgi:hypothetical protein
MLYTNGGNNSLSRQALVLVYGGIRRGKRIRVSLKHNGGGKFLILADEESGKFVGKRVDASDIVNCLI